MHHVESNIMLGVHGDDSTSLGYASGIVWYRERVMGRFEGKVKGRIGPGRKDGKAMRVLNRLVHWTNEGIEYEADQRHAEIIIQESGLKEDSKSVNTPREPSKRGDRDNDDTQPLTEEKRRWYRGVVASGNYLAQDRGTSSTP